jgi:hypothetical protein
MSRRSDKSRERVKLLEVLKAVAPIDGCTYCSAPITSGRLWMEWVGTMSGPPLAVDQIVSIHRDEHWRRVVQPNLKRARLAVKRIRATKSWLIIDPTAVGPIDHWTQVDWVQFWEAVIRQFAKRAVFVDGWEFSYGCTREFLTAVRKGIPMLNERGRYLSVERGTRMIRDAVKDLHTHQAYARSLSAVISKLEKA